MELGLATTQVPPPAPELERWPPGTGRVAAGPASDGWGWLGVLCLVGALGLVLVALAMAGAHASASWAELAYWGGLCVLFAPISARLFARRASRRERIGLLVALELGLYLIKLLHSPWFFTSVDELMHWRTAEDILTSGHLFHENPPLPVSPLYPGLENVTTALVRLSGLSIFGAGSLVIGVARVLMVLALYLVYEQASQSAYVAGIASLVYMVNPSSPNAQFAYESLAIPLTALVLFVTARRSQVSGLLRAGLSSIAVLGVAAVVITHHVTSFALVAVLVAWTLAARYAGRGAEERAGPGGLALFAALATAAWVVYVAMFTVGYLEGTLGQAVVELLGLIAGEATGRPLFRDFAGQPAPLWEQWTGYASVGVVLLGLPFGLLAAWRRHRADALALTLMALAFAYPATQGFRLARNGVETAVRAQGWVFLGVAFVLAIAADEAAVRRVFGGARTLVFTASVMIILMGGIIVTMARWERLPGPFLVEARARSIETQGIVAADWARTHLAPGGLVEADWTNALLMASYGGRDTVSDPAEKASLPDLFFSPTLDDGATGHAGPRRRPLPGGGSPAEWRSPHDGVLHQLRRARYLRACDCHRSRRTRQIRRAGWRRPRLR